MSNHEFVEYCSDCEKEFPISDLTENHSGYFCEDCFEPVCLECSEPMPEDDTSDFCSKDCYKEYMSDLWEDDYKDKE